MAHMYVRGDNKMSPLIGYILSGFERKTLCVAVSGYSSAYSHHSANVPIVADKRNVKSLRFGTRESLMMDVGEKPKRSVERNRPVCVDFVPGDSLLARKLASRWWGRELAASDYLGLAGNLPETNVLVGVNDRELVIEVWGEKIWPIWGLFHLRRRAGRLILSHEHLRAYMPRRRRAGLVAALFASQRKTAIQLGIDSIRHCGEPLHPFGTFEYWSAWGFDAVLSESARDELPVGLEQVVRIRDLMRSKEGRLWSRQCRALAAIDLECDPLHSDRADRETSEKGLGLGARANAKSLPAG